MKAAMEPARITEPRLRAVERELAQREPTFHHAAVGATRDHFASLVADEFWETGASGRRYSREHAIEILVDCYARPHEDKCRVVEA
jgi:hypothetical protein